MGKNALVDMLHSFQWQNIICLITYQKYLQVGIGKPDSIACFYNLKGLQAGTLLKPGTDKQFFFDKFYLFVCMEKPVNFISDTRQNWQIFPYEQIKLVKEKLVKEKLLVYTQL